MAGFCVRAVGRENGNWTFGQKKVEEMGFGLKMRISESFPPGIRTVSIIGMSKNAGKTTLFNQLLQEYGEGKRVVGLVSAGVDGEKFDVWNALPKPAVLPHPGSLVATSKQAIEDAEARFEIIEKVKDSSIGQEVYLARTIRGGAVKLIGNPSRRDLRRALQAFGRYGTEVNLIDGAYNRIASADPSITDGILLVAGASYHPSLPILLDHLRDLIFQFTLPRISPDPWIEAALPYLERGNAVFLPSPEGEPLVLDYPFRGYWVRQLVKRTGKREGAYLFLPGACTPSVLDQIM
ncbi:MAG: hypothetical protein IMW85_10770, partial [Thermicanus sp.]|nr:hypothetical protein [Thermicanus sp.]